MRTRKQEWGITAPSLAWLVCFVCVPLGIVMMIAFRPTLPSGGIGGGWSLDAMWSLSQPIYLELLVRTLVISALTTACCLVLALPLAWHLARASAKWRAGILMLVMIPFWTSFVIRVFAWQQILHAEGWIASVFRWCGWLGESERLLGHPLVVVLVSVYAYLPFAILPLYAAAERFDFSLIDAARDLGAGRWRAIFLVFLPGIRRGLVTALLVVFIPMLGSYVIPDMVGGVDSQMLGNKIAQRNFHDRNVPQAAALSVALGLLVVGPLLLKRKVRNP